MLLVRLCKTAFVAAIAFFFTLVAYGNLSDYDSNWQFTQHVLAMDTIFPDSTLRWRAITDPSIQEWAYWSIIAAEIVVAVVLWIGALRLLANLSGPNFANARTTAVVGLTLGFLLYSVGFVSVGGEWFAMWQSETWNGQQKAFEFLTMISAALIVVLLPEPSN
jgi:predicted small integral membrane protein